MPIGNNRIRYDQGTSYDYGRWNRKDVPPWVVVNEWRSAYYSGLDVSMYFNEVYMDEIVQLQFQEVEQARPLYGYADYVFRKISRGSRLVQGTFTINFKESAYIPKLLAVLRNDAELHSDIANLEAYRTGNEAVSSAQAVAADDAVRLALENNFTLEDVITMSKSGNYTVDNMTGESQFSKIMDAMDRAYWGEDSSADSGVPNSVEIRRRREAARLRPRYSLDDDGFDILLKYGQPQDAGEDKTGWGTAERIKNCHITGFSKTIDDTGRNTLEIYNFIASTVE